MRSTHAPFPLIGPLLLAALLFPTPGWAQDAQKSKPAAEKSSPKQSPQEASNNEQLELQKAIEEAGNDSAALVHNLESFLKKYPDTRQRPAIYRAIVEASLKVEDFPRATDYAERLVAQRPEDSSINILAIQLLERYGDAAGWRRAISYCTRVIDQVERTTSSDKSPRVSAENWENEKNRNRASLLLVRGRLYQKLNELPNAQKDFEASYALHPTAAAAEHLGEVAELRKDPNAAMQQYARAFALSEDATNTYGRRELRKKIGNVWRLAHGSEDGLGDYLLHTFDEVAAASTVKSIRNEGVKDFYDFTLRKAPGGAPFALSEMKGKIVVLNFWATWCGPCRDMEPHFERVAAHFAGEKDVQFFALNCDDDEALVQPFLEEEKPKTAVLFADNLDRLLDVSSYPTTVILDRNGKIAFRSDGFDPDTVDKTLTDAVDRILHPVEASDASAKL